MSETNKFAISWGPRAVIARVGFGAGRESIYPWKQLEEPAQDEQGNEVLSQFFVPGKTTKKFSGVAQAAAKRNNISLSVRSAEEDGVAGVLVQRVALRPARPPRTPEQKAAMAVKAAAKKAAANKA